MRLLMLFSGVRETIAWASAMSPAISTQSTPSMISRMPKTSRPVRRSLKGGTGGREGMFVIGGASFTWRRLRNHAAQSTAKR